MTVLVLTLSNMDWTPVTNEKKKWVMIYDKRVKCIYKSVDSGQPAQFVWKHFAFVKFSACLMIILLDDSVCCLLNKEDLLGPW